MEPLPGYDAWKTTPPDLFDEAPDGDGDECPTCYGRGDHARGCPDDPALGEWVDSKIDELKEGCP